MRWCLGRAVVAVALMCGVTTGIAAQATPPALGGCEVEPRTQADLERMVGLAATPVAGSPAATAVVPVDGDDVDREIREAIEETLVEVAACGASGDVARLLALYTDAYVVREVLGTEPVPILPSEGGTPYAEAVTGTPEVVSAGVTVGDAWVLADGRVAAVVERDGRREIVVFVEVDGRWRIDDVQVVPAEDLADLPPVRAAVADAAAVAGVDVSAVRVVTVEAVVWPDASLGCPEPGMFYAQVETGGYVVVVEVGGAEVRYHTDGGEGVVACDEAG